MRTDTSAFTAKNSELSKRPRYVVELSFDSDNTILWYFTSHDDAALPGGVQALYAIVEGISGTSQTLKPDLANASIGNISFDLVDLDGVVTSTLGSQLTLGRSTRRQRVRVYVGFEGLAWDDYTLVQTQLVTEISFAGGAYHFICADVQREMRKDVFEIAKTTLAASLSASATEVDVVSTATFSTLAHGSSYSDAPNATVGYVKIQDEVIRYTSKTSTKFILGAGGQRGALNTRAVEHAVDLNASADRRTVVEEYVYLEMPSAKLIYALLTGDVAGRALQFAPSGKYVTVPATVPVNVAAAGKNSIEFWMKWDGTMNAPIDDVTMAINNVAGGSNNIWIGLTGPTYGNYLAFGTWNGDITGVSRDGYANKLTHVVLVYENQATVGSTHKLYLDGVLQVTTTVGTLLSRTMSTAFRLGGDVTDVFGFRGICDGYRVYDRELSAEEVAEHFVGSYRDETGLVGRWDLDETSGTTSIDSAGSSNGTLVGSPARVAPLISEGVNTLPDSWHLGIPRSYVRFSDFIGIGADLWDATDDTKGFNVRFEGLEKTDGKKFIETELALLTGVFMPVYSDGALGLRRMANVLAGSSYVMHLDDSNLVSVGQLKHDFDSLHNVMQISWNWEQARKELTRVNLLIDAASVTIHGKSDPLKLKFRGLHGSRHSAVILAQRFESLRDRYTGPPLRITAQAVPRLNTLEVGDVVRLRPSSVRDFVANADLDRSFEIQNITLDWITGQLSLQLFGSSQAPSPSAATADSSVLTQAWYTGTGTALSSVLTITGSNPGHVTAGGTLTGSSDLNAAPSIFYYDGDLQIDAGVNINVFNNVQLRVRGFLQNNGTINGTARGHAGAASVGDPAFHGHYNAGTPGFLGTTVAGGGLYTEPDIGTRTRPVFSSPGGIVSGSYPVVPTFNLSWDGTTLSGMPSDLRGSSGSSGMTAALLPMTFIFISSGYIDIAGGAGGAGGAGLAIVSRGFAQGAGGKIDLSGGDGSAGAQFSSGQAADAWTDIWINAGGGAGGAPGGLLILLDGAPSTATGLTEAQAVANQGRTPISGTPRSSPVENWFGGENFSSYYVGSGDGNLFALPSMSGARGGSRVQYVPALPGAAVDPSPVTLVAPTGMGLASGTAELLIQNDGTIVPRVKVTWIPTVDARAVGYDIQFKPSSESVWSNAPAVLGGASSTAWLIGLRDGVDHDVRLRAAGPTREVSDWVTIDDYFVVGKTEVPANVGALSFTDPILSWTALSDVDLAGYIVRYHPGSNTDWATALLAHVQGFITETRFDTGLVVGESTTMLVKAVDTSGHESASVSSLLVDLRPPTPISFSVSRQPDGTRELFWSTSVLPADFLGVHIRWYLGSTSDWTAMTPLHNGVLVSAPLETNQLASGTYTFAVKNVDRAGNESATALFVGSVVLGEPRISGSVGDFREEPTWIGTKNSCHVDATTGWLVADGTGTWTGLPSTWTGWTAWNSSPVSPISYERLIDLGEKLVFTPQVTVVADGSVTIEEQHSDDGSSYSSYAAITTPIDARYVRIKVTVTGSYPKIKSERIVLAASIESEYIEDQDSSALTGSYRIGTGDVRVPIVNTYSTIKTVSITLQSVGAGWSWELIDKDTSVGPRIKIYNSSDTLADAVFDATVVGITS